jgi:hypothetical protein
LLERLRLAGATHFFIGFESLDIRNLEYVGKHVVPAIRRSGLSVAAYYAKQIRTMQDHGISIHGAFILGLPYDYFHSFSDHSGREIADFCIAHRIGLQPCSLTDLPGSRTFRDSQEQGTWLYGRQGTMDYLLALCVTDLTESNRAPPPSLAGSPLLTAVMALESARQAATLGRAISNGLYMARKALAYPTAKGRRSLQERLVDSEFAFTSQLIVSLYREHGERVAHSNSAGRGTIERLYNMERDAQIKADLSEYVRAFMSRSQAECR